MTYDMSPNTPYTRKYALCRLIASKFIAEAGERAVKAKVQSEGQIAERIRAAFAEMDADENLYLTIKDAAKAIWTNANCAPTLARWGDFSEPKINCGVLVVNGDEIIIEKRKSLSADSIEGRSYKIAMSADATGKTSQSAKEVGRSSKFKRNLNPLK